MNRLPGRWYRALIASAVALKVVLSADGASTDHVLLITIDGAGAFYLSDSNAPLPTLRRLVREGAVAEGMQVASPAVTWPNHTTLVTGVGPDRHSVLFNGVLTRPGPGRPVAIDPARSKSDLVAVPTLYDRLHPAGLRVADINWPCTRGASTLEDSFPDVPEPLRFMTPRLREELISAEILESADDAAFKGRSAAVRDQVWTAAATHVVRERRPNLLLFHMLICDSIQHRYGPQSPAAYTALAVADAQLADVLRAVDAAGIRDRTTVFVTADHGFDSALKLIQPNVRFRKAGLLEIGTAPGFLKARAQSISEGGTAFVYLPDPATRSSDRTQVLELLRDQEGIAEILTEAQFPALHLPVPGQDSPMADLVLVAKPGYAFGNEARGEDVIADIAQTGANLGYHGFLSRNARMNALFVAWGRGIRPGPKSGLIRNVDVAPTIAHLLGVKLPGAEGRVLTEFLSEGGR